MRAILKILIILAAVIIGAVIAVTASSFRPEIGPFGIQGFSKGFDYPGSLIAALTPGPVRDDLEKRGLITSLPDSTPATSVNTGDIYSLIQQGIYFFDKSGNLQLGPVSIPGGNFSSGQIQYIYSQRITQLWAVLDNFDYTGHSVYVTLPASFSLPADGSVIHNLYNTHLTLPDGKWVESGAGWVNWTTSPIIYTYDSYRGQWNFAAIPGGTQRDIFLKIDIGPDLQTVMSASDPLSGKTVTAKQKVNNLKHRIDFSQEQTSASAQWVTTPPARFHDSQIKTGASDWVIWDSSVITTWSSNPPMTAKTGMENGQAWTETACRP
jgi:hypothetical protein